MTTCKVDGCTNEPRAKTRTCKSHQSWKDRHGTFDGWSERRRTVSTPGSRYGKSPEGYSLDRDGYVRYKRGMYHRHIMAEHLGRKLYKDESVHHKDGNKQNNHISNLELWSRYQPAGQRVEDKLVWAREIIARYES